MYAGYSMTMQVSTFEIFHHICQLFLYVTTYLECRIHSNRGKVWFLFCMACFIGIRQ